ncbi:hypothetical protein KEM56_005637, partial [Ascosphaera pollenicola]
ARYVHANYRFIVSPKHSYSAHAADPDIHLPWAHLLQVLVSADYQPCACPICLCAPVAPRMPKCGHVFCLPCLIRYMHSDDDSSSQPPPDRPDRKKKKYKKCPICEDSIYLADATPVRFYRFNAGPIPAEGSHLVLTLVERLPGNTLALPRDASTRYFSTSTHSPDKDKPRDVPWYEPGEIADFARIMKGGRTYMLEHHRLELEDLKKQQQEDEVLFGDDTTWMRKAAAMIREAIENVKGLDDPPHPPEKKKNGEEETGTEKDKQPVAIKAEPPLEGPGSGASKTSASASAYYFYQALPHFYLSPLDIRILRAAFGSYDAFPAVLLPRIEHISSGRTIDEDLRKRTKYLSHLPFGCEVNFLECDWSEVVEQGVLDAFDAEIKRRRKRHWEKKATEDREKVRAEKAEREMWASTTRIGGPAGLGGESEGFSVRRPFTDVDFPMGLASADTHASHEDAGAADTNTSDGLESASASASASAAGQKTVWGTVAPPPSDPNYIPPPPEDDGWLKDWEQDLRLQELMLSEQQEGRGQGQGQGLGPDRPGEGENENEGADGSTSATATATSTAGLSGTGKKKKKGKKITLMSTTARRAA